MEKDNVYNCDRCGKEKVAGFIVKKNLWMEGSSRAGLKDGKGALCRECFEKALGRPIQWNDLLLFVTLHREHGCERLIGKQIVLSTNFWLIKELMHTAPTEDLKALVRPLMNTFDYHNHHGAKWVFKGDRFDERRGLMRSEDAFINAGIAGGLCIAVQAELKEREKKG